MLLDVAYVGNKADDLLLVANYNQAVPNNPTGNDPARVAAADFDLRRHHLRLQRRQVALQGVPDEVRVADGRGGHAAQLADAVEGEGQRAPARSRTRTATSRRRRTSATSTPTSACRAYHQPYNSTTSFVWALPFGHGKRWGNGMSTALDVVVGGWQLAGINTITPGEMVTFTYTPAAAFQVSAITNDFSGANNYRPNITCDPYAPAGQQSITQLVQPGVRRRCRPIRASRSATRRATTCAARTSGSSISPPARTSRSADRRGCSCGSRRSTCSTA